ncbi:MAG: 50S ribosomal protein L9 [Treponema sp.]|nr:50S ribosomal protein L9 [Treponema sp.]
MKVILIKDLSPLGEDGDVKDVASGYARNFLFPRKIAVPYNEHTVKLLEARREVIESRKQEKRLDAAGIKEKLESIHFEFTMPAGPNGKLYGAVTTQTIADELAKQGHQIERKRIELAGSNIKSVGKYKATIRLYENATAEITVTVAGQEIKTETKAPAQRPGRRHRDAEEQTAKAGTDGQTAEAVPAAAAPATAGATASPPAEKSGETGQAAGETAKE